MKPVRMTKISVTGPRNKLRSVIETLYEMEILDIDEYEGELETGDPFEEAEDLSETLVDVRSLISKLPEAEEYEESFKLEKVHDAVDDLKREVEKIDEERKSVKSRISDLREKKQFFRKLEGVNLSYGDLKGTETLDVLIGRIDEIKLAEEVEEDNYEIFSGRDLSVAVYDRRKKELAEKIDEAARVKVNLPEIEFDGEVSDIVEQLEEEEREAERSLETMKGQLEDISDEWYGRLVSAEKFLTEKVEKAEAPIRFASTEKTFIAQGWIPEEEYEKVEESLCEATEGKIHIQREEAEEEPPVKHDNPGPVSSFESLTDLMSVPSYNELDPSFVLLLTFPVMFGFMIGDAGYGLSSFIVFLAGYRMFPKAKDIFKSLMWASGFTFLFGLYFSEAFGHVYNFFGEKSQLAAMTGIEFFRKIPVFHKGGHSAYTVFGLFPEPGLSSWTVIFGAAALIGVAHVNFGYLLGFYNEVTKHGFIEAFLEKGSWIMLELSAVVFLLYGPMVGGGLALLSVVLLYMGEGIEGVVEIPSLLSNILSYLRLFGVAVAAFSLAKVVNALADPLFQMGGILGIGLGIFMLVFGHTFNTFIKIIEGFLQGIRLHYVEMFSKFYEGGGRKYIPFGARDLS